MLAGALLAICFGVVWANPKRLTPTRTEVCAIFSFHGKVLATDSRFRFALNIIGGVAPLWICDSRYRFRYLRYLTCDLRAAGRNEQKLGKTEVFSSFLPVALKELFQKRIVSCKVLQFWISLENTFQEPPGLGGTHILVSREQFPESMV